MRFLKFVPYLVTKKELTLPFTITICRRKKIFISLLLLLFLSIRESMGGMLLVGADFALE